jgi:hypothetical protein
VLVVAAISSHFGGEHWETLVERIIKKKIFFNPNVLYRSQKCWKEKQIDDTRRSDC